MPIVFNCPSCQAQLTLSDAAAGRHGKCPHCKGEIVVPAASSAVVPAPPPQPTSPPTALPPPLPEPVTLEIAAAPTPLPPAGPVLAAPAPAARGSPIVKAFLILSAVGAALIMFVCLGLVGLVFLVRGSQAKLIEGKYVILRGDGTEVSISFYAGFDKDLAPNGQHMVRWASRVQDAKMFASEEEADQVAKVIKPLSFDGRRYYDIRVRSVKEVQQGSTR
jgi:hypothetical protein